MPTWHLPQVAATLAWLTGELRSTLRLMSWTPWQSLQDGATISPICVNALPWMLSVYWVATCGYFIRYSAVTPGLLWHLAQVLAKLSLKTGEAGSLTARILCVPWQSEQVAAAEAPIARLMP